MKLELKYSKSLLTFMFAFAFSRSKQREEIVWNKKL